MTSTTLVTRARELAADPPPLPGGGNTPERHRRLLAVGAEDLSLAKIVEAHWDAVAILAEAGRRPEPGCLYAVWASEAPGQALVLHPDGTLHGAKRFASGLGLVDRALVTVHLPLPSPNSEQQSSLLDLDLRAAAPFAVTDGTAWATPAFAATQTGTLTLAGFPVDDRLWVGAPGWYLTRPGFWNGALGPAACWAGGAAGLCHFALASRRADPHTRAHLGAMAANTWAMEAVLTEAGREIDQNRGGLVSSPAARALAARHLVETLCTDTLHRFARALGPAPLATDPDIARRYAELDLYLRQSHAERDLEALGDLVLKSHTLQPRTS